MSSFDQPVVEIETTEIMDGPMGRHGYVRTPRSRVLAAREDPSLGASDVEAPQSIERPKGFPAYEYTHKGQVQHPPPDGKLISGGIAAYAKLDGAVSPSGKPWPAMPVTPGGTLRVEWWLTARHKTELWHYYITKDGWDQSKPLTRSMLEPLCSIHWHLDKTTADWMSPYPINDVQHWVKLPAHKTGRHILYAVWDVADTANAFYQGTDIEFVASA